MMIKYLKSGKQTKITKSIRDLSLQINGIDEIDYIKNIYSWINKNLRYSDDEKLKSRVFRKRTADQIISDGYLTGCTDTALVFIALCRAKKIPTRYIEGIFKNSDGSTGHIFVECYINKRWIIADPTNRRIGDKALYENYDIIAKGLDFWDIGTGSLSKLRAKVTEFRNKYPNNLDKIATHPLQTSAWAEFRRKWGNEVLETKWGLITVHRLPFTDYRIGIFEKGPTPTRIMLSELRILGKKEKLIFIKLEPNIGWELPITNYQFSIKSKLTKLLKQNGTIEGKRLFTPTTFQINLKPSEEELMKNFSSKTRYNIRVAQRNGVTVKEDNSDTAFERYLKLTKETVRRQGFFAHTEKYHRLMWNILKKAGIAHLFVANYKKQIITTWILFKWGNFLYYPYGASTEEHKNVMANNLMMWEVIKFGKRMGLSTFDLWGRELGKGFTKFKEGYNPKVIEFLGTWDLVINKPLYTIYRLAEKTRWLVLKFSAKLGLSRARF